MHTPRRVTCAVGSFLLSVLAVSAVSTTPAYAATAAVHADIHISEVFADGGATTGVDAGYAHDFIELANTGAQDEDVSGWVLKDDTDSHAYVIDAGTVIPAGGYASFNVDDAAHAGSFGIGKGGDAARVYDGSTLVDQFWFSAAPGDGNDFNRCSIGGAAYEIVVATGLTPGAADNCPDPATALATVKSQVKVNEVLADGSLDGGGHQRPDSIELTDSGTTSVNLAGWWLTDDKTTDKDVLPAGTVLKPRGFLSYAVGVDQNKTGTADLTYVAQDVFVDANGNNLPGNVDFGIGKGGDNAAIVAPDTTDADRVSFGSDAGSVVTAPATGNTIARCPDGTGAWQLSYAATLGAANICANPTDAIVKINEVDLANGLVELINTSSTATADLSSGFTLGDSAGQSLTVSTANTTVAGAAATSIPARAYAEVSLGATLSAVAAGDTITLRDGSAIVDASTWASAFAPSWGRCADGTGAFTQTVAVTDGAVSTTAGANACPVAGVAGYETIRISEVETNGDPLGDWIEVANTGAAAVNISGVYLADNGGAQGDPTAFPTDSGHYWQVPGANQNPSDVTTSGNTVVAAHGYLAFYESNTFPFGLGGPDQARVFSPSKALVDATSWPLHEAGVTYERCPGVTQGVQFTDTADSAAFVNSFTSTPNAANDCRPPVRINEVQASDASGGPDWVELTNVGAQPVDLSGWVLADDKDADGDVVPSGTTLNPGAFVTFQPNNEDNAFTSPSKPFGLGATGDEVRLYQAGAWSGTAYVAADLVDTFVFEDTSTKSGGAVQPQTVLADGVTKAGGPWPVNSTTTTSPETYARCSDGISKVVADGTGAWQVTSTPTRGTANACDGLYTATPWPDTHNGQAVTTADNVDLGQNVSGLFYQPGATSDADTIWAIQNGSSGLPGENPGDPGALYKLVKDSSGQWGAAAGWAKGVPVRYLNNTTGEPDSEGVTAVDGKVYVASERDDTNDTVSKIAVLEVDPDHVVAQNGDANGDLNATHEWDLGSDLGPNPGKNPETGLDPSNPGDANLGPEGIAFVPDAYLTSAGFKDEHTGAAYDPASYPNHIGGGVFFVALEKTGDLYAYEFNADNTFTRVATISTGFQTIQDVQWDPSQHALWAVCDNGCQGRSSIIAIDSGADAHRGTFQVETVYSRPTGAVDNLNNEGFTVQPATECVNGTKSALWSDDGDDGGHWLRTASVDCTEPDPHAVGATVVATVSGNPGGDVGWYTGPVTVSFSCTDIDAVLTAACPGPVQVTTSKPANTVATLTDTSGLLHPATAPAININGTQTSTPTPIINGTGKVGTQLTATIGTWDSAVTTSYEWLSGNTVLGENGPLTLLPSYVGSSITLAVTGTKLHFDPVTTSASLAVLAGDLVTKTPTISGTAQVGDTLTAAVAAWGPGTVFLSYQWYANGQAIAGANSRTLTLAGLQAGTKITVAVTGAEFGYATATVSSAPTGVVTPGVLVVGTPTTSGTFQVGTTVTANPGNWSAGTDTVTFTYQWWANGARIVNATTATLTLTKNQLGKKISVRIAGSALGYTSATKTSGQSSPVKP